MELICGDIFSSLEVYLSMRSTWTFFIQVSIQKIVIDESKIDREKQK